MCHVMNYFRKLSKAALMSLLLPLVVAFPLMNAALAQDDEERRAPPEARSSQTLGRAVYQRLEDVMELRDAGDEAGALEIMDELREMYANGRLNTAEELRMWQFFYSIAASNENYLEAIQYQQRILDMGDALTIQQREDALYALGQLSFATENYQQSIDYYLQYLDFAEDVNIDAYQSISYAYYSLEDYAGALPYALEYRDQLRAAGEEYTQSNYQFLRSLYTILEDFENALQLTREMIVLFKEPDDWQFLIQALAVLERFDEQAEFLYAMKTFGYLEDEGQYNNLAAQFFNGEYYWGAAKTLEEGIDAGIIEPDEDTWSMLGQSYQLAREDAMAIEPLTAAAQLAEDGQMYSSLSTVYLNLGQYADAAEALDDAFAKGGLTRPDQAYIRQARVYLELNRFDDAIEAARMAGEDERSEEAAATWVRYLQNEKNLYETKERQRELYEGFFR